MPVRKKLKLEKILNTAISQVTEWLKVNKLSQNICKSNFLTFPIKTYEALKTKN